MAITLGSNTITGVSAGGYGSGVFTGTNIASGTINKDRLASSATVQYAAGYRNSNGSYGGDSGWNDFFSFTFSNSYACRVLILGFWSCSWESGPAQGYQRFLIDGNKYGWNSCVMRQTTANTGAGGSGHAYADIGAGTHTIMMQVRQPVGGATWQTNYWTADGEGAHTMVIASYN
jgi:hypothetical protein